MSKEKKLIFSSSKGFDLNIRFCCKTPGIESRPSVPEGKLSLSRNLCQVVLEPTSPSFMNINPFRLLLTIEDVTPISIKKAETFLSH